MAAKYLDLVVRNGEYTVGGTQKSRWLTIGKLFLPEAGKGHMILLDRSFNPAGVPISVDHEEKNQVYVYCFEPKTGEERASETKAQRQAPPPVEDDIPF